MGSVWQLSNRSTFRSGTIVLLNSAQAGSNWHGPNWALDDLSYGSKRPIESFEKSP